MLAAALRLFLLFELALYVTLAYGAFNLPLPQAVAAALAWFIGGRAGFVSFTYLVAVAHHSPAPRVGFLRALRMFVGEFLAFLALFVLIQPFERLWMGGDRLVRGRPLVLLVHGYGCNRGAWWWLRRQLEAAGHSVATVNLEPPYTDIENYVPQLQRRVEEACAEAGCHHLQVVAHSMGGLVARAYLRKHGSSRVAGLVTLASPHAGSELSRYGIGPNARQMTPGSSWLTSLAAQRLDLPVVAVRNCHDNFVMPQNNQRLSGADDVELPALGHLAMLFSPRVATALGAALVRR